MRYKRVLLVFPAFKSDMGSSHPSPSLGYLARSLSDRDVEYSIVDMKLGYNEKTLFSRIESFNPDLVGFTLFTLYHGNVYQMISRLKRERPETDVAVGGPHVTVVREKVLKDCPSVDYACVGEGEDLIGELCEGTALNKIRGLVYRENGAIIPNQLRGFESDLDRLGFPYLKNFELNKYAEEVFIVSSRGCPYPCIFCSVHTQLGKDIRTRSVGHVVDEIEYWYKNGKRLFNFVDDNFTFYEDRAFKICDEIERRGIKDLVLRCSNGVRADKLSRPLLLRMKEVGFYSIAIGVEGGNNKVLKLLRKGETIEQIEDAIKTACDLGYEVALFFTVGVPGETEEDIEDSIRLALKYPVFKVDFYDLVPFPGTELNRWVNENNAWVGNPNELLQQWDKSIRFGSSSPLFTTKELSLETRKALNPKLRGVMKEVEKRYIKNLFEERFGETLSTVLSYVITMPFVARLYFSNNLFRKLAENFRYFHLRRT